MELLYVLIIGAIAGWLAGQLFRGFGFGLIGNIAVGIVGSFIGFWLLGKLGISFGEGLVGTLVTSIIGAGVLLFIIGLFKRR
ncbi:MAG: GlsB/YeaQ/YmgE family stress response membrane protein [Saprospiraceae bacterium]|nr:MAG: GlsB/YeaQ/YmgE family stress response membrane protein [Saprospiraceae bacterium]